MTREELLELVEQDSNDYDESVDGWVKVQIRGNILFVVVEKDGDTKPHEFFTASWRLLPMMED